MYQEVYYASWSVQSTRKTRIYTGSSRSGQTGPRPSMRRWPSFSWSVRRAGRACSPRITGPTRERRCSRPHARCCRTRRRPPWFSRGTCAPSGTSSRCGPTRTRRARSATWPFVSSCACEPWTPSCSATTNWGSSPTAPTRYRPITARLRPELRLTRLAADSHGELSFGRRYLLDFDPAEQRCRPRDAVALRQLLEVRDTGYGAVEEPL